LERLESMAAIALQRKARETLDLAQAISAGFAGGDCWIEKQEQLIERIKPCQE
jgi:hypothetical protein